MMESEAAWDEGVYIAEAHAKAQTNYEWKE
jgi:hypothetical protein